jgi:Na+/proline symporter
VHADREKAAVDYVIAKNQADLNITETAKQNYLQTNDKFNATRKEATEFIKTTNNNKNFNDVNYVFPNFVIQNMPMGVIGLIIAAIFAAAMSSVSSELNALATATVIDFYRRHFKTEASDRHYITAGRIATLFWGIFACIVAVYATNLGSLIEVVNRFGSFFYGSLLGVFVLAIAVKRANSRGAFFGLLFGISSVWIASNFTDIAFLWFNVIGCLITVLAGYLISLTVSGENNAATS